MLAACSSCITQIDTFLVVAIHRINLISPRDDDDDDDDDRNEDNEDEDKNSDDTHT